MAVQNDARVAGESAMSDGKFNLSALAVPTFHHPVPHYSDYRGPGSVIFELGRGRPAVYRQADDDYFCLAGRYRAEMQDPVC